MTSPDGRPVFFSRVPWQEEKQTVSCDCEECTCGDPVFVDASGTYVNGSGEPLSQEDFDNRPKGV